MLKARYIFTIVIGCLAFLYSKGQKNLILNGGMEDTLYCSVSAANNIQQFKYWYNPTIGGSWAYHKCVYNIPTTAKPRSGYGCASAYSYNTISVDEFNYVAGKFSQPLEAGKQYCFTMYVRLWDRFKYGSNNLGVFIENNPIFYNTFLLVPTTPKFTLSSSITIIDTVWYKFQSIYTATGGETDFMVGGYMPYASANNPLSLPFAQSNGSQFIYDDFSLTESNTVDLGNDRIICAQSDSVVLGDSAWTETAYRWFANGVLIDTLHSQIKVKPNVTTTYILKKESCSLISDTIAITVVDDCNQLTDGIVIPNVMTPNGDGWNDTFKVFIENGTIQRASIYNRWGNIIYEPSLDAMHYFFWDGHTTSGEACNSGTYFYVISYINSQNEQKTVKGFVSLFR